MNDNTTENWKKDFDKRFKVVYPPSGQEFAYVPLPDQIKNFIEKELGKPNYYELPIKKRKEISMKAGKKAQKMQSELVEKANKNKINEIRNLYERGDIPLKKIAEMYNISYNSLRYFAYSREWSKRNKGYSRKPLVHSTKIEPNGYNNSDNYTCRECGNLLLHKFYLNSYPIYVCENEKCWSYGVLINLGDRAKVAKGLVN